MMSTISWRLGRLCWQRVAKVLRLPHNVPLLRDELEISLLLYLIYKVIPRSDLPNNLTLFSGVFCLCAHFVRGSRWQLTPIYIALLLSFYFSTSTSSNTYMTIFISVCIFLALILCFLTPIQPPIVVKSCPDKVCVGIQDIVLIEPGSSRYSPYTGTSFIARAYYPIDPIPQTIKTEYFLIPALSVLHHVLSDLNTFNGIFGIIHLIISTQIGLYLFHNAVFSEYVPEGYPVLKAIAKFGELPWVLFSHLTTVRLHCREDGLIAERAKNILLFYPGLCCSRTVHASACMEAAHKGYFVVCLESSDRTPPLSVTPPEFKPRAYKSFEEYLTEHSTNGDSVPLTPTEIGHQFRHDQLNIRTRESQAIMDFLKKHSLSVAGTKNNKDDDNMNIGNIYLGFSHLRANYTLDNILSLKWWRSSTLQYFNNHHKSAFWASLHNHKFQSFEPVIMGHSFGGATALHLGADEGSDAVAFRSNYPIRSVVAYDPWTDIPLSEQVKNMPTDSFHTPTLLMAAEHFEYFTEYNIVNACKHVISLKIRDAGHHSYNEFAFFAPLIGIRMKNHGLQDAYQLIDSINEVSHRFLASVRETSHTTTSCAKFDKKACLDAINALNTYTVLQIKP